MLCKSLNHLGVVVQLRCGERGVTAKCRIARVLSQRSAFNSITYYEFRGKKRTQLVFEGMTRCRVLVSSRW